MQKDVIGVYNYWELMFVGLFFTWQNAEKFRKNTSAGSGHGCNRERASDPHRRRNFQYTQQQRKGLGRIALGYSLLDWTKVWGPTGNIKRNKKKKNTRIYRTKHTKCVLGCITNSHPGWRTVTVVTECGGVHHRVSKTGISVWGCSNPYSTQVVVWSDKGQCGTLTSRQWRMTYRKEFPLADLSALTHCWATPMRRSMQAWARHHGIRGNKGCLCMSQATFFNSSHTIVVHSRSQVLASMGKTVSWHRRK